MQKSLLETDPQAQAKFTCLNYIPRLVSTKSTMVVIKFFEVQVLIRKQVNRCVCHRVLYLEVAQFERVSRERFKNGKTSVNIAIYRFKVHSDTQIKQQNNTRA